MRKTIHFMHVEMLRSLLSPKFLLAVVLLSATVVLGNLDFFFKDNSLIELCKKKEYLYSCLISVFSKENITFVLPLFAVLPFSSSYLEERENGFLKSYLPRCGQNNYILSKIIVSAISSGIVVFLSALIVTIWGFALYHQVSLFDFINESNLWKEYGYIVLMAIMEGILWGTLGSVMGVYFESLFMVFAGPFLISYTLIILTTRYFTQLSFLNPRNWLSNNGESQSWIIATLTVLIIFAITLHALLLVSKIKGNKFTM